MVSGLLVKTPNLRMRLDRALAIMRTIADDPSGMHLSLVGQLGGRAARIADPGQGPVGPPARLASSRPPL